MSNPNLTKQLNDLADLANQAGAEGIWLIRGAKDVQLTYIASPEAEIPFTPGLKLSPNPPIVTIDLVDAEIIVVIRFPAGDGGEPGIESR